MKTKKLHKLIVGLGNPEQKYTRSRHNTGWMILDYLIRDMDLEKLSANKNYELYGNNEILAAKPLTHMNRSGVAVTEIARYYKIKLGDIWIVNDDIDLKLGKIKIRLGSSSAGHRGVQSIICEFGAQDFWRFRVGVDNREKIVGSADTDEYVMADFRQEELGMLKNVIEKTCQAIRDSLTGKIKKITIQVNI